MIPTDYEAEGVFPVKSTYKLAVQILDQQKETDASTYVNGGKSECT